jgi:hypothetical protein
MVVKALLADEAAWTTVEAPRHREASRAEASFAVSAANFAADRT